MGTAVTTPVDYHPIQRLLDAENVAEALSLVTQLVQNDPSSRQLQLYYLLTRVMAFGPEQFEVEIERRCFRQGLSENERAIATRILRHGFESATRKGDAGKAWAYQRALRRFVAGLPLDRPLSPVRCGEAVQELSSTASFSAVDLANLRAVFSEERGEDGARATRRIPHFSAKLKGKIQSLSALRSGLKRCEATRDAVSSVVRNKILVKRDASSFPSTTTPMHRPGRSRAAGRLVPTVLVFLAGMGVSFVSMKVGELTKKNPRIATSLQPAPASLQIPLPVLHPALIDSPIQQNGVTKSARPNAVSPDLGRTGVSNNAIDGPVESLASAQRQRETIPRVSNYRTPLVFKATQIIGLRDQPRFGAPKGDPLENGTRLIMMEQNGSWLKVRNEATGSTGYVRKEFVAPVTPDP